MSKVVISLGLCLGILLPADEDLRQRLQTLMREPMTSRQSLKCWSEAFGPDEVEALKDLAAQVSVENKDSTPLLAMLSLQLMDMHGADVALLELFLDKNVSDVIKEMSLAAIFHRFNTRSESRAYFQKRDNFENAFIEYLTFRLKKSQRSNLEIWKIKFAVDLQYRSSIPLLRTLCKEASDVEVRLAARGALRSLGVSAPPKINLPQEEFTGTDVHEGFFAEVLQQKSSADGVFTAAWPFRDSENSPVVLAAFVPGGQWGGGSETYLLKLKAGQPHVKLATVKGRVVELYVLPGEHAAMASEQEAAIIALTETAIFGLSLEGKQRWQYSEPDDVLPSFGAIALAYTQPQQCKGVVVSVEGADDELVSISPDGDVMHRAQTFPGLWLGSLVGHQCLPGIYAEEAVGFREASLIYDNGLQAETSQLRMSIRNTALLHKEGRAMLAVSHRDADQRPALSLLEKDLERIVWTVSLPEPIADCAVVSDGCHSPDHVLCVTTLGRALAVDDKGVLIGKADLWANLDEPTYFELADASIAVNNSEKAPLCAFWTTHRITVLQVDTN